jgi:FkbM family methyltransferase
LSAWAAQGAEVVERTGMHGIRFERDGIWIDSGDGYLWTYTPGLFGSALGAEFGLHYERFEVELLAERLRPGGVLVDVGANVGLYSIQLARRVERLKVLAFEPVAATYETLRRNLVKNGADARVDARRLALGERRGAVRMTTRLQAGNFMVEEGASAASEAVEGVEVRRLDDVLAEVGSPVDAIKCDVEGAELGVLRGGEETLERDRPTLLLEIDERWVARYGHTGADVLNFLIDRGYRYERIVGEELLPPSASLAEDLASSRNFLFTSRG